MRLELLKKETGIIELTLQGKKYGKKPFIQTDYDYELLVDPVLNKPAFILRSDTQIIYSSEDYIQFKSFAVYVFESEDNMLIKGDDLWKMAMDGRQSMNELLHSKLNTLSAINGINLSPLEYISEVPILKQLIIAAFRLN